MARAAAPAKKVEAVKAPEDAKKSVFVAEIRARFGGVRDITGTQVMDMCNTLEDGDPRDPRLPRPGWFLDSDEWRLRAFGADDFLYSIPKEEGEDESLAEMLALLGPKKDVECGIEATNARLEERSVDFNVG